MSHVVIKLISSIKDKITGANFDLLTFYQFSQITYEVTFLSTLIF